MARAEPGPRERILNAAVGVFADHGFRGATTRRLGHAAGVNSALIHYYFKNKDGLFRSVIRMVIEGLLARVGEQPKPLVGAAARLGFLVDAVFAYGTAHPERMRLVPVVLSLHPEAFAQTVNAVSATVVLTPLAILQEGMDRGELRRQLPLHAWWSILGLCLFSLQLREVGRYLNPVRIPEARAAAGARRDQIVELLLCGLAVQRGDTGGPDSGNKPQRTQRTQRRHRSQT